MINDFYSANLSISMSSVQEEDFNSTEYALRETFFFRPGSAAKSKPPYLYTDARFHTVTKVLFRFSPGL